MGFTAASIPQLSASGFEVVGKRKIDGLQRFPSDHWGIHVDWKVSQASPVERRAQEVPSGDSSRLPPESSATEPSTATRALDNTFSNLRRGGAQPVIDLD